MSLGSFALLKWIHAQEQLHASMNHIFDILAGWKVAKRYTRAKGRAAFNKLVRDAAKSYVAQKMTPLSVRDAFPAACRGAATTQLEKAFRARFKEGQWAHLVKAHKDKEAAKRQRERKQAKRAALSAGLSKMSTIRRMKRLLG